MIHLIFLLIKTCLVTIQERMFDRMIRKIIFTPEAVQLNLATVTLIGDLFYLPTVLQDRTVELTLVRPVWWPFRVKVPDLTRLKYLRYLDCSDCLLTSLPVLPASLRILICRNNLISEIRDLKNVTVLIATGNRLSKLPTHRLQVFDLRGNRFTSLPFSFASIIDGKFDPTVRLTVVQQIRKEQIRYRKKIQRLLDLSWKEEGHNLWRPDRPAVTG